MDNSQSSDIFSDTHVNIREDSAIDILSYEELVSKIKAKATTNFGANDLKLSNQFSSLLDDCSNCVFQGLDVLVYLLEDASTPIDKLCCYLEETIYILQVVSNSIKNIIESMAVTFATMKTFSITTGNIILSVFSHCKESECIYESHITRVEKQLKDLFRNCHELQLIYLVALEKHYIFDLTETEQQDILMETLDINLRIGELVQALDVKTMAEQWKAYTVICDKYSTFLLDKDTFNKTTKLLVNVIHNNIKTSFEVSEEDKVVIRSLKVASFSLKILLRICKIFKCSFTNSYEHIVELLQEILLYSSSYTKVSSKIINITNTHLLIPSEAIISHLVTEENFVHYINSINIINLKDLKLLQYILLLMSVMKASAALTNMNEVNLKMITLVISVLPHCHTCFNMGLKFPYMERNHGLFEHVLVHTVAAATSLDTEYYMSLEKLLYEAVLSTDYYCAVFCSNLWVLLCRFSTSHLHLNTLISLIDTHQTLDTNVSFLFSPQRTHLCYTIEKLFQTLNYPEKLHIYKQFSVYRETNDSLWSVLKIRNLPDNLQMSARKVVSQKVASFVEILSKEQFNEHLQDVIKVMKLASTCEFLESDSRIEHLLVKGWCKVCPKANVKLQRDLDVHSVLYLMYLEALSSLTESYYQRIEDRSTLVKIQHVISTTLQASNNEVIRILFKIFFKLIIFQGNSANETVTETFKYLLERDDTQTFVYSVIVSNEEFDKFTQILLRDNIEALNKYTMYKSMLIDDNRWRHRAQSAADNIYYHKCIQNVLNVPEPMENELGSDSESVDFDFLRIETDNHPVNKKPKLDTNIEKILERLESDTTQLCREDILNEEHKTRIKNICDKLQKCYSK